MIKRYSRIIPLLLLVVLFSGCNTKIKNPHWVINEVMVNNQSSLADQYGNRSSWIEIYNNTAKTQDLAGCFLTTDRNNPKMYAIPQGDVMTIVKPHQQAVFFADNTPSKGTFHTNFTLSPTEDNYIALYNSDGKTLLDEIIIPAGAVAADEVYGYEADGIKYDESGTLIAKKLDRITPGSNNLVVGENPKIVALKESDASGGMITFTSMLVVFTGLLLLFLIFKLIGYIAQRLSRYRAAKTGKLSAVRGQSNLSGEVLAAISAAIHQLNEDQHDIESTVLTISEVKRRYSPWNSKFYGLKQLPRK